MSDRRHPDKLYMPIAISVRDLVEQVALTLPPDTPKPTEEWVRLQFQPPNPFTNAALRYTGRFNLKHGVQRRVLRKQHEDSNFVAVQNIGIKKFLCKHREHSCSLWLDDKATIPVGDPGNPLGHCRRGATRSIVPAGESAPVLAQMDHDYHVAGVIPSVTFISNIPPVYSDSFYDGKIFVTLKDRVFQPSSPMKHGAELEKILIHEDSNLTDQDGIATHSPIMAAMSDGGKDHLTTLVSVQVVWLAVFLRLVPIYTAELKSFSYKMKKINV